MQSLLRDPEVDQITIARRLNQTPEITYRRRPRLETLEVSFTLDLGDEKISGSHA